MVTRFARTWTWVAIVVALVALVAIIGPGHVRILTFIVAVLVFSTVTLRVIHGVRGGVARAREEANSN